MGKASYREIGGPGGLLAHCASFEGNTMWARWTSDHTVYEVFSYSAMIACYRRLTGEVFVSDKHWSNTTTRQQNLCRAWLATARPEKREQ